MLATVLQCYFFVTCITASLAFGGLSPYQYSGYTYGYQPQSPSHYSPYQASVLAPYPAGDVRGYGQTYGDHVISSYDQAISPYAEVPTEYVATYGEQPSGHYYQSEYDVADQHIRSYTGPVAREAPGYGHRKRYRPRYHKPKRVYIPVPVDKKKKKKNKAITLMQGMYIENGMQLYGKFKSLYKCQDACDKTPNCFAADYNKWLYKCYIHTNLTACSSMRSHPQMIHFKKIPCSTLELPTSNSLIVLGAQLFRGFEQKGVTDLKSCLKKCINGGAGIARTLTDAEDTQVCFAINFDFANYKCYVFPLTVNGVALCTAPTVPVPRDLVANPSVIHITLCFSASGRLIELGHLKFSDSAIDITVH